MTSQIRRILDPADPVLDDYLRMTDVRLRSRIEAVTTRLHARAHQLCRPARGSADHRRRRLSPDRPQMLDPHHART